MQRTVDRQLADPEPVPMQNRAMDRRGNRCDDRRITMNTAGDYQTAAPLLPPSAV